LVSPVQPEGRGPGVEEHKDAPEQGDGQNDLAERPGNRRAQIAGDRDETRRDEALGDLEADPVAKRGGVTASAVQQDRLHADAATQGAASKP
jgi:hypothetical protein